MELKYDQETEEENFTIAVSYYSECHFMLTGKSAHKCFKLSAIRYAKKVMAKNTTHKYRIECEV